MLAEQDLKSIRAVIKSELTEGIVSVHTDIKELRDDVSGLREQIQQFTGL